jgi:hypothetical protein
MAADVTGVGSAACAAPAGAFAADAGEDAMTAQPPPPTQQQQRERAAAIVHLSTGGAACAPSPPRDGAKPFARGGAGASAQLPAPPAAAHASAPAAAAPADEPPPHAQQRERSSLLPAGVYVPRFPPPAAADAAAAADALRTLLGELQRCCWVSTTRLAHSAVARLAAWHDPRGACVGVRAFVDDVLTNDLPVSSWSGAVIRHCARASCRAGRPGKARAAAVAPATAAVATADNNNSALHRLPFGVRMPRFAANEDDDDVAALLAELGACGWLSDARVDARIAGRVARWRDAAGAAAGLRRFVADVARSGMPQSAWNGALITACRWCSEARAAADAAAPMEAREERALPPPLQAPLLTQPLPPPLPHVHHEQAQAQAQRAWQPQEQQRWTEECVWRAPVVASASAAHRSASPPPRRGRRNGASRSRSPRRRRSRSRSRGRSRERSARRHASSRKQRDGSRRSRSRKGSAAERGRRQLQWASAPAHAATPPQPPPPPPLPPAVVAPAGVPSATLRFLYRGPVDGQVAGPFRLSAFANWAAIGALSSDAIMALRVWREGGEESESVPLAPLLAALQAGA